MYSAEPLVHFVDDYLAFLYEVSPTAATFDGVHTQDDLLEDLSRGAIEHELRELGSFARRLSAIDPASLSPVERLERPMVESHIRSRVHELEEVRTWERDPQHYAELVATGLAGLALFAYAPASERARRVVSKLHQVPRLIQAARDNIKEPPGIFVKNGLESLRGALKFIERDLPRAFADVDDLHLLGDLADASTEATAAIAGYATYLETELGPRSKASFRLGPERFGQKLRLDEGITIKPERLLDIATRELLKTQDEFRRVASRLNSGDPIAAWRKTKEQHPAAGDIVNVAREQLEELAQFIDRQAIVSRPQAEPVVVAPSPDFYRWTFASMWTPGPFEARPIRAIYYLTDVDPAWTPERKEEHLRDFSFAALWAISIHEVYPGHYLHYQHLRRVESKLRKSILFAPASFVEGWAHYAEQMMMDEGFGKGDPSIRLGQLAESLIRLARVIVGIRLHTEDLSVEQGVRIFRDEAFMEEGSARREAERGTFDPGYVVYSLGKLMLLKLRRDHEAKVGGKVDLRAFHDTLLRNGNAPIWLHRQLMLGEDSGALLE